MDNFWKDKKVLITGHTGFKGTWLSLWLIKLGAKVMGYSLNPDENISLFNQLRMYEKCTHYVGDILDKELFNELVNEFSPDIVFHLAAQPLVGTSYEEPLKTWSTNVIGTINLLEILRELNKECVAVLITTDKVYQNKEWEYAYREEDPLGGYDPYSSSKAAAEIAISSWRSSFCGDLPHQTSKLFIASARAGNVIGGGDWTKSRIIPDLVEGLSKKQEVLIRNPLSTRPWQHVLEPLSGYIKLAKLISIEKNNPNLTSSFNFGPELNSNQPVRKLVKNCLAYWDGIVKEEVCLNAPHEANFLNLSIDKSFHKLNWKPSWDFETTVERTINWYKNVLLLNKDPLLCCMDDLEAYDQDLIKMDKSF